MKKKGFAVLAALLVAAGFVGIPFLMAERSSAGMPPGAGGRNAKTVFSVRTALADRRTLQAYIEVNGNVVAVDQVNITPDMGGRLVSMRVSLGQTIWKDQLLAEVDPSHPGETYSLSPVYSPINGIVISTPVAAGSTVTAATPLMTVAKSASTRIEAFIPEREIGQLKNGLKAVVTLEAFPGENFSATIVQVSPVVDTQARTKKIILSFDKSDSRINPGMFARLHLNTRTYTNVISVPSQALTEIRGRRGLYVQEGENARFVEVETGVAVDGETEIRSGLEGGENVVIQGQQFLTDGAPIKVIGG
jgi:multidrug efflux pump subunit AcrA (membrane-fusion protein)